MKKMMNKPTDQDGAITLRDFVKKGPTGAISYLFTKRETFCFQAGDVGNIGVLPTFEWYKFFGSLANAKKRKIIDAQGNQFEIKRHHFFTAGLHLMLEGVYYLYVLLRIRVHVYLLQSSWRVFGRDIRKIAYLRTDFLYGIEAGGSIGHTEGIVNAFRDLDYEIFLCTTKVFKGIHDDVQQFVIDISPFFKNYPEIYHFYHTYNFFNHAVDKVQTANLIYQRYSLGNCSGGLL